MVTSGSGKLSEKMESNSERDTLPEGVSLKELLLEVDKMWSALLHFEYGLAAIARILENKFPDVSVKEVADRIIEEEKLLRKQLEDVDEQAVMLTFGGDETPKVES